MEISISTKDGQRVDRKVSGGVKIFSGDMWTNYCIEPWTHIQSSDDWEDPLDIRINKRRFPLIQIEVR